MRTPRCARKRCAGSAVRHIDPQISERAENIDFRVHRGQVQDRYVRADRKNLNRILLNVLPDAQAPDVQA